MSPGRRIQWVFLDAGETLFDVRGPGPEFHLALAELDPAINAERCAAAFEAASRGLEKPDHVGPPPDYCVDQILAARRRERFVEALVDGLGISARQWHLARQHIQAALAGRHLFALYPDVPPTLRALRRAGYRLGIISNWSPELVAFCADHGIGSAFELILASEAEGYAKPSPALFQRALTRAGADPEEAVHVGDSLEHDVLGAAAVGMAAVLVDRGGYYPPGIWRPTVSRLDELPVELVTLD